MDRPNEESSPRKAAVTRADVARYARVSTAVVSYVINDGPRAVSEATAARVRDAIERLGYRPNSTARALAVGSTKTIGLVVPTAQTRSSPSTPWRFSGLPPTSAMPC